MDKAAFITRATQLQAQYQPSPAVKEQLAAVDMILTVGPTAVGKTTIMRRSSLHFTLSDVTREPREGEEDGVDYNFRTDYDRLLQELEAGEFVQFVIEKNGEFYGTKAGAYPTSGPATMAAIAATVSGFRSLGFRRVVPMYIVPPSYEEWMSRIGDDRSRDLAPRFREARESLEIALSDSSYLFLINDDLDEAVQLFEELSLDPDSADKTLQEQARTIAKGLLDKLPEL